MKKVLVITTHFAPDRHIGAKRMTKFAKYLPEYGWQPIVLTKAVSEYHGVDDSLLAGLPSGMAIHRVPEWGFHRNGKTSTSADVPASSTALTKAPGRLRGHLLRAVDLLMFYDYSWLLPAFLTARRLIKKHRIPVIYSSIPNREAHLVALLLKITMGIKWVCEYRDPWTRLPVSSYPPASALEPPVDWALEGRVLEMADRLIFVGPRHRDRVLKGRRPGLAAKAAIIYNGYDEEDFVGLPRDTSDDDSRFTIGHIGTWGRLVTPEPFLIALGQLMRQRPELRSRIHVRFIGEVRFDQEMTKQIPATILREGLQEVVTLEPFLPHRQAVAQMCQCHALLFVRNDWPEAPDEAALYISGKLFEYLRARRPILALAPPEGDAGKLVRDLGAGVAVAAEDIDAVATTIYDSYVAFSRGELVVRGELAQIQQFERRNEAGQLAKVLG